MTAPNQPYPDLIAALGVGAYQVGGEGMGYGQDIDEAFAKSIAVPTLTSYESMNEMVHQMTGFLRKMPLDTLKMILQFLPGVDPDSISNTLDAVDAISDALTPKPGLDLFQGLLDFFQAGFDAVLNYTDFPTLLSDLDAAWEAFVKAADAYNEANFQSFRSVLEALLGINPDTRAVMDQIVSVVDKIHAGDQAFKDLLVNINDDITAYAQNPWAQGQWDTLMSALNSDWNEYANVISGLQSEEWDTIKNIVSSLFHIDLDSGKFQTQGIEGMFGTDNIGKTIESFGQSIFAGFNNGGIVETTTPDGAATGWAPIQDVVDTILGMFGLTGDNSSSIIGHGQDLASQDSRIKALETQLGASGNEKRTIGDTFNRNAGDLGPPTYQVVGSGSGTGKMQYDGKGNLIWKAGTYDNSQTALLVGSGSAIRVDDYELVFQLYGTPPSNGVSNVPVTAIATQWGGSGSASSLLFTQVSYNGLYITSRVGNVDKQTISYPRSVHTPRSGDIYTITSQAGLLTIKVNGTVLGSNVGFSAANKPLVGDVYRNVGVAMVAFNNNFFSQAVPAGLSIYTVREL